MAKPSRQRVAEELPDTNIIDQPDIDDDGTINVERYRIPTDSTGSDYLDAVFQEAQKILDEELPLE